MRIAVLDLGTNTFNLLIVDTVNGDHFINPLFRRKLPVKLGEGAIHRNIIADKPFERGLNALRQYALIIKEYKADRILVYATSAIRGARNKDHFIYEAEAILGEKISVITGQTEAKLIYQGVRHALQVDHTTLIMDIGGGSTEFIIGNKEQMQWIGSYDIGVARLMEILTFSDPIRQEEIDRLENVLDEQLVELFEACNKYCPQSLTGVSGSFDTLAELIANRYYKPEILENAIGYEFFLRDYHEIHQVLLKSTLDERLEMPGLVPMRADMIVVSSCMVNYILNRLHLKQMFLSAYSLKEGAIFLNFRK